MQINSRSRQILKKGSAKIDPNKRENEKTGNIEVHFWDEIFSKYPRKNLN